uniref:Formin-like protein n=1 Tax=Chenopodium quinoa TaxID=63459 RepID=A0A803KP20_CHEQI
MLPVHKLDNNQHQGNGTKKIVTVAVVVPTGVVVLVFALGVLLWFSKRTYRHKKVATGTASVCSDQGGDRERSKSITTENLARKVTQDLNSDLFYIDTLTSVLEPQTCLRGSPDCFEKSIMGSKGNTSYERKHSEYETIQIESKESSSLAEEIISVHEYTGSSRYESDDQNSSNADTMDGIDKHSSEDESFHSLCDSHSSSNRNIRLSNASYGSFGDPVELFSPNHSLPANPPQLTIPDQEQPTDRIENALNESQQTRKKGFASPPNTPDILDGPRNIPPPPCPPPYFNGKASSSKGPPPPPGPPPPLTPLGKDGAPLPKLKPLHWDKVRAAPDRSMVWDQLRCSSFELDEEMIESLFGYNLKNVLDNDEGKSKSLSPSKHVLEPKRLQNITILSKALNATSEKVCEALKQGEGLSSQQLEALVKMAPTEEEETKLSNYKGDINELGSAEKLVKEILTVPNALQRIEAMLYRATFDDEVVHLRNSFQVLEEACKELRSSRLFLKLLEAVLKTGNRMNVGTSRGGAKAFKLDALLKLADVKGTDGKTTLLHFVVQEMIRSEGIRMSNSIMGKIDRHTKSRTVEEKEDSYRRMGLELVSGLSTELCNVKRTASIDLDVLATSVSNLSDGMSKLLQLVNKNLDHTETNGNFVHAMKAFLNHAENNLKELQAEENNVLISVREITEYYHGDVSKDEANPLRIFVIVRDFLGMLDQVCKELKSLKIPRTPNPLAPFQ